MDYYQIGIIYQIYYINNPKINYIGSSFNNVSLRWIDHMSDYNKYLKDDRKPASAIYPYFKELNIKNFEIRELKECKVIDKNHLKMYEQLYINKYKPVNRVNPFNILINVDKKNYQKQHYIKNKEEKSKYSKLRYINNKEYFNNYIENNREKIKEYKTQHYQKNKEKITEKAKEKILCIVCNKEVTKCKYIRHCKTNTHINNLKYKDDIILE